jgi:GNAT superfamily N-acetyltransferase
MRQQSDQATESPSGRGDAKGRRLEPLVSASIARAGALLGDAFVDDPVVRYYFEELDDRTRAVQAMMTAAAELAVRFGSAWCLECDGRLVGVALLLPPSRHDFPLPAVLGAVLRRPRLWRARGLRRYLGVGASIEAHRPELPCWTLVSLGILPAQQGRGHGSWLLEQLLAGLPPAAAVFLETFEERNLSFYGARGFAVTSRFAADGGRGPQTWTMLRAAGAATATA